MVLFAALALRIPASGQGESSGAIAGFVSDACGAAFACSTVTLTSPENGLKRVVKTDEAGRGFSFPQLKPGIYSV